MCVDAQEYTEEFRDIAKGKSKESLPTGPITLLNQRPVSEDVRYLSFWDSVVISLATSWYLVGVLLTYHMDNENIR